MMSHGLPRIRELEDRVSFPRLSNYYHELMRGVKDFKKLSPSRCLGGNQCDCCVTLTLHMAAIRWTLVLDASRVTCMVGSGAITQVQQGLLPAFDETDS